MPANGIRYMARKDLLSFEEMERLVRVLVQSGVNKLRITGGEPLLRNGILDFLSDVSRLPDLKEINLTTNGTLTADKIETLERIGIRSINLSLDSLDPERFHAITRRDVFHTVKHALDELLASSLEVKINMVVMAGRNTDDIYPMLELARHQKVNVRFIEEMPFNGTLGQGNLGFWPMTRILDHIRQQYPIEKLPDPVAATASHYRVPGFAGSFGVIAAFTRNFCGSCNRIRVTPQGGLRTCLYGDPVLQLRDLMREGISDDGLQQKVLYTLNQRARNGFEAEAQRAAARPVSESMATIGG